MTGLHHIKNTDEIITPALVYYKEVIIENTKKAIERAGGPDRLWPHVKSHKTKEMVALQMSMGITRFKCATIAEAEMLAQCKARDILLAYPLVGPNQRRFVALCEAYPDSRFWAIGDDYEQLCGLSRLSTRAGRLSTVLIDMNLGMNRTGVPMGQAEALYLKCLELDGLQLMGFHCYDGNHNHPDIVLRKEAVAETDRVIQGIKKRLADRGVECPVFVMGGTPSFPCHAEYEGVFLSPGTAFLTDAGYYQNLKDLDFVPGAALLTRVISHPSDGMFTLDLGYKGIASDPAAQRGYIVNGEAYEPVFQSEEHWVFCVKEGSREPAPPIGTLLYVIPTHICPTSALYPSVLVAEHGEITDTWEVAARNRKLTV